ncbi:MAG: thioesterase family protein [Eisenbergiella sp.]
MLFRREGKGVETGIRSELMVTGENTASAPRSGRLCVAPGACRTGGADMLGEVELLLEEGETTVGTALAIKHLAPTPVGMKVWCESRLVQADGRRMVFQAEVFDESGKIGEGEHERFLVRAERFQQKADAKGNLQQGKEQEING